MKTYKRFEAEIYVLTKDEGGRHTAFESNYRPQFYLRTADVTGKVELPESVKMVLPGDNVTATFELISPVPLEAGMLQYSPFSQKKKNTMKLLIKSSIIAHYLCQEEFFLFLVIKVSKPRK